MASAAQLQANRSNAQKSTDPRTAEGKAVVVQNPVKHGLLAKEVVVKREDPGEFELYRDQMLEELAPAGQMESMLAQQIVGLAWRLRRAERLQAAAFAKVEDPSEPPELVLSPEQASRILDRLLVYERRIEHSLYRTMGEFRRQRLLREMEPLVAKAGLPRSTGILPVSSMGVPPMTVENIHGQDARDTHGRDAHATKPPAGGTPNESCETNPIGTGANDGQVLCGTGVISDLPQGAGGETNPRCDRISSRKEDAHAHIMSPELL